MKGAGRWLLPLSVVPVILLLAFGLSRDATVLPSALVGSEAPDFHLETIAGDTVSLDDLRGHVAILNFWASWCLPCRDEHPILVRASETWPDDVVVAGVLYQDSRASALRFMQRLGGDWPSGMDPASRTAIDYGVYGVPETFFLSRDGRVARKHIGPITWQVVESAVDSLLSVPAGPTAEPAVDDARTPEGVGQ